jgi:hypothetical protein
MSRFEMNFSMNNFETGKEEDLNLSARGQISFPAPAIHQAPGLYL